MGFEHGRARFSLLIFELVGPPHLIMGVLSGKLSVKDAKSAGMTLIGTVAVLDRLRREAA